MHAVNEARVQYQWWKMQSTKLDIIEFHNNSYVH